MKVTTEPDQTGTKQETQLPQHIGFIMDGNGRWALGRGLPRARGHEEGLKAAKRVVRGAAEAGIPYLSLYTFSTENWKRTPDEVKFLMGLVSKNLRKEFPFYQEYGVHVLHSGDVAHLPKGVQKELQAVEEDTREFSRIQVNLAINYGGRDEIVRAVNRWKEQGEENALTADTLRSFMDLPEFPDPDLIVRTGGEYRLSNFLLWGSAYSELMFSSKLWPDWSEEDVYEAVRFFQSRKRNFGGSR